jgi:hypothetical protein
MLLGGSFVCRFRACGARPHWCVTTDLEHDARLGHVIDQAVDKGAGVGLAALVHREDVVPVTYPLRVQVRDGLPDKERQRSVSTDEITELGWVSAFLSTEKMWYP